MKLGILLTILFLTTLLLPSGSISYYLNVPGGKGDVTETGFENWYRLTGYSCRLPGVPAAKYLLSNPPKLNRGIITAAELKSRVCSFSKPMEKGDDFLYKAFKDKQRFNQWQMTLCTPEGKIFMNFLFKGVTISGISGRNEKLYVTFSFERVIWNYSR